MNKVNYNGFASEEQYEAAMNIIKNAIDEYTDTIGIELKTNSVEKYIVVMVETKELNHFAKYFVNDNGVFYVNLESENMPIVECKIFAALNEKAGEIFKVFEKKSIEHFVMAKHYAGNAFYGVKYQVVDANEEKGVYKIKLEDEHKRSYSKDIEDELTISMRKSGTYLKVGTKEYQFCDNFYPDTDEKMYEWVVNRDIDESVLMEY